MYSIIYDFMYTYLLSGGTLDNYETELFGVTTSLSQWLAHMFSIVSIALIFIFLVIFLKWLFKLVSGLFLLK